MRWLLWSTAVGRSHLGPHHSCMPHVHAHAHTHTHTHTHTHNSTCTAKHKWGERNFPHNLVIQALPSFSGTGQTEVGWSASAAGKAIKMKLPSGMCLFLFPMGQEEEVIHAVELGQCCGLAHDKQEREQVSPSQTSTDSLSHPH